MGLSLAKGQLGLKGGTEGASEPPDPSAPVNSVAPMPSNFAPYVGLTITANPGSWSGYPHPSFTYKWQRSEDDVTWEDIPGETSSSLEFTEDLYDPTWYYVRLHVTATNAYGSATATSPSFYGYAAPAGDWGDVSDTFDDLDAWTIDEDTVGDVTVSGGLLLMKANEDTPSIIYNETRSLIGSAVSMQVLEFHGIYNTPDRQVTLDIYNPASSREGAIDWYAFRIDGEYPNALGAAYYDINRNKYFLAQAYIADPDGIYIRIRETDGTMYFEYTFDYSGTWTSIASIDTPEWAHNTNCAIFAWSKDPEENPVKTIIVDNFNRA